LLQKLHFKINCLSVVLDYVKAAASCMSVLHVGKLDSTGKDNSRLAVVL
jgi:hypothetical protein